MAKKEYSIKDVVIMLEDMRNDIRNILNTVNETLKIVDRVNLRIDQSIKRLDAITIILTS